MDDYYKLLERGLKKLPHEGQDLGRFSIPAIQCQKSGAKTIINNILEISSSLRRETPHLVKFLLKELATKGEMEGQRLIVLGNFTEDQLAKKLDIYLKNYVICPVCNKPDTKIVRDQKGSFLICEACGNKKPLTK